MQNPIALLFNSNNQLENLIEKQMPFTITTETIKYSDKPNKYTYEKNH